MLGTAIARADHDDAFAPSPDIAAFPAHGNYRDLGEGVKSVRYQSGETVANDHGALRRGKSARRNLQSRYRLVIYQSHARPNHAG